MHGAQRAAFASRQTGSRTPLDSHRSYLQQAEVEPLKEDDRLVEIRPRLDAALHWV
ncbi:hypothetical protein DAETH_46500 (plasmid) [Deinococcus aetherius]|uniref:Uncharacterized protein n=1 Tax=Deinococcus aetherius TaxID=200252 RepID=A0ABN6RRX6_9DEIO|nr:hypothetical protein DAETH_46500 [Deinococcus aetherius]